ncbi:MAG: BlaI/MecI/CopY family transcriptional regulator [Ruminococcaceae bacterium]|nr:BlaI/MecI/CopY family transcriptional regulator [Oscillospiraceae bacterium]
MEQIMLSDSEWKIMKLLWKKSPYTLGELAKVLEGETGWTRATVFVMLKRLIAKGAVRVDEESRIHEYYPTVKRRDIAPAETESFLNRVYDGSIGMLFTALTERNTLSDTEIAELRQILDNAEKKRKE